MISFFRKCLWLKNKCCCCHQRKYPQIYVLKLEKDKYYIGESYNKKKRIQIHKNGNGSSWTKKYKVIKEIKPITKPQFKLWELVETLNIMNLYGINNVRGSLFSSPFELTSHEKTMAAQLYCELNGLCRKCGYKGHFISNCNNKYLSNWVHKFGGNLIFIDNKKRLCQECGLNINNSPKYQKYCSHCYFKDFNKNNMID